MSTEWYQSNRARVLAEKKQYYAERRELLKQKQRDYRERNAEQVRQKDRERGPKRRADTRQAEAQRKKAKEWYQRNREYVLEKHRATRFLKEYGITLEQYDRRCEEQGHRCAICHRASSEFPTRLVVDHCHETGLIRGLLCDDCNWAIGRLGDTADRVAAAYRYLAAFENAMVKSA